MSQKIAPRSIPKAKTSLSGDIGPRTSGPKGRRFCRDHLHRRHKGIVEQNAVQIEITVSLSCQFSSAGCQG
jgi:hypothetical protein